MAALPVRKMDHAFLMGRRGTWAKLTRRPSEYFKDHCFVAPFPEENVHRVIEIVGTEADRVRLGLSPRRGTAGPHAMYLGQLKKPAPTRTVTRSCAATSPASSTCPTEPALLI